MIIRRANITLQFYTENVNNTTVYNKITRELMEFTDLCEFKVSITEDDDLITQSEAAKMLGISLKKVNTLIRLRKITGYEVGGGKPGSSGRIKVNKKEIEEMKK